MRKMTEYTLLRFFVWLLLIIISATLQANDGDVLSHEVKISKNKGSVYQLLKQLSDQSGYLFIYDSQIIDNNKTVKIRKGSHTLREAIYAITENDQLKIDIVNNHILLRIKEANEETITANPITPQTGENGEKKYFTIAGRLYDRVTDAPIIYCSVSMNYTKIGTITNQNGEFQLIIPDSLCHSAIKFSHVGYLNQEIEAELLAGQHIRLSLEPKIIPLQEIIVRVVDPVKELNDMLKHIEDNYSSNPSLLTAFYREGVDFEKKNINLTEAVLQIYKTGHQNKSHSDQAKLVKMRRIVSKQEKDTIFSKMKSGIHTTLVLDVIKDLPDFITGKEASPYLYTHTDISMVDNRRVNVISFEQGPNIIDPLYKGQLYIDAENSALVEVRFEVNPQFIEKATNWYVEKKGKDIKLTLQEAKYIVSYRPAEDDKYYINHVRGDLQFKVKRKGRLFSAPMHMWFEMVNCKTETENIKEFEKKERISPYKIFSATKYRYDKNFWEHFNIILPEEKLKEIILHNLNEVSDTTSNK